MAVPGMFRTAVNLLATRRQPVSIIHFVTNECNARCPHCFLDFSGDATEVQEGSLLSILEAGPGRRKQALSLSEIDALTRRMGNCLNNVNLTGGEPFLRPDLLEIARLYFRNAGVRTMFVTTHGGYPDRILPFARTLAGEYPDRQLMISISIDHFQGEHDRIRGVKGLFDNALRSYRELERVAANVTANVNLTISHTNHGIVQELYEHLVGHQGVSSITAGPARDEGVYRQSPEVKEAVLRSYVALHALIKRDMESGRLHGFDRSRLSGRLMNAKNDILFDVMVRTKETGEYISPCHAAAVFGVLGENGDVYPCEILDRPLGNVRDYDYDFMALWRDAAAADTRRWIRRSHCHCDFECAWTFNILGNWRYQPRLVRAALGGPRANP